MNSYRKRPINKYHNTKVIYDGIKFDSKRECNYYKKLKLLERVGEITDLQRQVPFCLQPSYKFKGKKVRAIMYIADFVYVDKNKDFHVVDVKGFRTDGYKIKKKMFEYLFNKEIEEI